MFVCWAPNIALCRCSSSFFVCVDILDAVQYSIGTHRGKARKGS